MRKLIQKVFVFLSPILLVLVFIEVFYRIVPNNYSVKNESLLEKYQETEILILGDSHTFYGLNPVFFDKPTYNLSNISQSLYFDKLLFDKHIDKFKKLKTIILNIDYTSLSQLKDTDEDIWRKYYYKYYMNLEVPIINWYDRNNYFISGTKSFSSNLKLTTRYFSDKTIVDCDKNGFGTNYTKQKRILNIEENAITTIKRHEDHLTDFTENIAVLESIIAKCKSKGIRVVLVIIPVSKNYAARVNKKKIDKIFKCTALLQKMNSNVSCLNLFNDSRFTNDDFYDADHLHNVGAEKCSLIVAHFLKQKNNQIN